MLITKRVWMWGGGLHIGKGGEEQVKLYPYKKGEMENKLAMLKGVRAVRGEARKVVPCLKWGTQQVWTDDFPIL